MTESIGSSETYEDILLEITQHIEDDMVTVGGQAFGGLYLSCTPDDNQIVCPLYWRGHNDMVLAGWEGEIVRTSLSRDTKSEFILQTDGYGAAGVGSIWALSVADNLIVMGSGIIDKYTPSAILVNKAKYLANLGPNAEHINFREFWDENFDEDDLYYAEACARITLEAFRYLRQIREENLRLSE